MAQDTDKQSLILRGDNLNDVLGEVYHSVIKYGRSVSPRGNDVLEWQSPVMIELDRPQHPWTFFLGRKLNPYFALAEVIWILAGRDDVDFIAYYNKNMRNFSDDGKVFHGAYGDRIRNYPMYYEDHEGHWQADAIDQIHLVVERLRKDSQSRQSVICLWDSSRDLKHGFRDYPCNNMCYFTLRDNRLDMSVIRRSNDMIWGLPYNQIQFYFLHALIAGSVGAQMGRYYEYVQNMHVYTNTYPKLFGRVMKAVTSSDYGELTEQPKIPWADRRISVDQFDVFSKIFFPAEAEWRNAPERMSIESIQVLAIKMLNAGVPRYWVENMLVMPLAYIARKNNMYELHDQMVSEVDPGVQWLVQDFIREQS